jgi:hypothetical protein
MSAVVELGFSAPAVFTGIDRVEKRLMDLNDKVSRFGGVDVGSMIGGASLAGVAAYLKSSANEMSALVDSADRLRSTPETIQRVTKAVEILGGTDLETISSSLDKLARDLVSQPDGGLAQSLRDLGFSAQAYLEADVDEKLFLLADAFAEAQSRGTALPLLTEALGKSFTKLIPTLQTGRSELKAFMDGTAVISNAAVMNIDQINDRFDIMSGKIMMAAKTLSLGVGLGLMEMLGLKDRTQITPDGGAGKNAEIDAAAAAKRRAEANAAIIEAQRQRSAKSREETAAAAEEALEKTGRIAEAQAKLDEEKRRAAMSDMESAERITALRQMITESLEWEKTLRSDFVPDAERIIAAETRTLALQRELTSALKEQQRTKDQAAQTAKREADEAARANQQRKQAVMSAMDEYNLLKAKSTARKNDDYQVERDIAIRNRRDQLMKENGLSMAEATRIATEMRDMEERAANNGRDPKIRGPKPRNKGKMGGLDEFHRKQSEGFDWDWQLNSATNWDVLQKNPFSWEANLVPGSRAPGIAERNARNATEPTPAKPISLDDALVKILTLLPKNIASALMDN